MFCCEECDRRTSGYAPGWSIFLVQDPDDDTRPFPVTYCADCALREFGWLVRWIARTRRSSAV